MRSAHPSKRLFIDYQVPAAVSCRCSDGIEIVVPILEFIENGVFVEMRVEQLPYAEHVHVTFLTTEAPLIAFEGEVVTVVRGRGVRIEAVPDTKDDVFEIIGEWVDGHPATVVLGGEETFTADEVGMEKLPPPPMPVKKAFTTGPRLDGTHVLVIDDDPLVRRALERVLGHLGARVTVTGSPPEGLAMLEKQAVDAVLLDWILPRIPGQDMLAEIHTAHGKVPVAIISGGLWWEGAEAELAEQGADAVLRKPLDISAIATWIKSKRPNELDQRSARETA